MSQMLYQRLRINKIMNSSPDRREYGDTGNLYIEYQSTSSTRVRFDQVPNSPRYNTRVYTQVRIHWIEYYAVYYHGRERPLVHTEPGGVQHVHYSRARRTLMISHQLVRYLPL